MATQETQLSDLVVQFAADMKDVLIKIGDVTALSTTSKTSAVSAINELVGRCNGFVTSIGTLANLNTTAKTSLVAAINELQASSGGGGSLILDTAGAGILDKTWSADKIISATAASIAALKTELVGGAQAALDTFKEIQDALGNDPTFAATLATSMSKRVRFDAAQTLTVLEQQQACANLGIGDPTVDYKAMYIAARDA